MTPADHHRTPSGWADDRLMMAYDLVHEVMTTHGEPALRKLLAEVEAADDLLAGEPS